MTNSLFLTAEELRELTGFALKSRQMEQLRSMGIPFFINGCDRPVVTRFSIVGETNQKPLPQKIEWKPAMMQQDRKAA
jgi:hypothetical protein